MLLNVDRATQLMDQMGMEAIVATTTENVTYLCDYRVPAQPLMGASVYVVMPRSHRDASLILPSGELSDVVYSQTTCVDDLRPYGEFYVEGDPCDQNSEKLLGYLKTKKSVESLQVLLDALKDKGLGKSTIGIDERGLDKNQYNTLVGGLPNAKFIDAYELFRQIRMVKTAEEIERLEEAVRITEDAIVAVLGIIAEGVRLDELIMKLKQTMIEEGTIPDYPSIGISTDNFTQNIPPQKVKRLKRGDLIRFDVGCSYKNYHSDIARTAVLGKANEKQRKYYEAVLAGENEALSAIKPGRKASDLYRITMDAVRSNGIPHYKRVHVGHGIGLEFYDLPSINPKCDIQIEENMVVIIETPYYEVGFGGVQVEDCGVVTGSGYRLFNRLSRELIEIQQ